jgi:selenocysteine lyase/cysteine desulfurase
MGVSVRDDGTISKRAYRNRQLQREGWKSLSERERVTQTKAAAKNPIAQAKVRQHRKAIEAFAKQRGISLRAAAMHDSDLERAFAEARQEEFDKTYGGALHRYLQLQGKHLIEKDDGSFGSP